MQPWLRFLRSPAGWGPLPQPDTPLSQSTLVTPLSRDMLLAPSPLLRSSRAEPCVRRAREWPLSGARAHSPHGGERRHYSIVEGPCAGARFWITADVRREAYQMSVFYLRSALNYYRETRARAARAHTYSYIRHTRARALARLCARALCAELCAPTTKLAPRHLAGESHTHTWISHCEVIRSKPIAFVHVGGEQAPGPGSAWLGSGSGCQG